MNKLVLLRHGQSQWNLENRFTGWEDVPLTKKGIDEALVPHGFGAVQHPVTGSSIPTASFVTAQTNTLGVFDQNVHYGFNFATTAYDNAALLVGLAETTNAQHGGHNNVLARHARESAAARAL